MKKTYSIKCTKCSAPLNLLGGGRVKTVTCSYCKSLIDLNDNYKVLSNFKKYKEKNRLPFEIGMKGILNTIEYTIIGRITYQEDEPPFSEWSDFLLFSPLYGYGWLTYENGHLIYSRRNRTFPNISWITIPHKSSIRVDNIDFKPFSDYSAKVVYVEGEMTWIAKKGDKTSFIDLIAPPFGISAERTDSEIEYYKSEYLDSDTVYSAFSVSKENQVKPKEFNILQPFKLPIVEALSKISMWVMVITILLFTALSMDGEGETVSKFNISNTKAVTEEFNITSNRYLTNINLKAKTNKELENFNIKIYKNSKLLFSLNGKNAYRFDITTGKIDKKFVTWESKAKSISIYLKLESFKGYKLTATDIDPSITSTVYITIKQQEAKNGYLKLFFLLAFVGYIIYKFIHLIYKKKLQEEQTIFDTNEKVYNSVYDYLSNNIFAIIFTIFILFMIFKDI